MVELRGELDIASVSEVAGVIDGLAPGDSRKCGGIHGRRDARIGQPDMALLPLESDIPELLPGPGIAMLVPDPGTSMEW